MKINKQVKHLAKKIIEAAVAAGEGHIPSSLSILDILYVLFTKRSFDAARGDTFILSKGHASLALYAVLEEFGYLDAGECLTFCQFESRLGGHPDRNKLPSVTASTGSLGHGLPIAIGVAMAKILSGKQGRVYCLVGDGECNEGTIWESMLVAAHHNLKNLTIVLDHNNSTDRAVKIDSMEEKAKAFGFEAITIDGHDHSVLTKSLNTTSLDRPLFIVAKTVKGAGIPEFENNPAWHHRTPNSEELQTIMRIFS